MYRTINAHIYHYFSSTNMFLHRFIWKCTNIKNIKRVKYSQANMTYYTQVIICNNGSSALNVDNLNNTCFSFNLLHVFRTYLNHSRVRLLEPNSTGVIWGIMVMTRVGFDPSNLRSRGCEAATLSTRSPLHFHFLAVYI